MSLLNSKFRALVSTALLLSITLVGAARSQAQAEAPSAQPISAQVAEAGAVSGQGWPLFACLGCAALFVAGTAGAILPVMVAVLANPGAVGACAVVCVVAINEALQ